jgi:hypothetical protein
MKGALTRVEQIRVGTKFGSTISTDELQDVNVAIITRNPRQTVYECGD